MSSLGELMRQQIHERCTISRLYCELLESAPPTPRIVGAAHDWTLRNIETLVNDLLYNEPKGKPVEGLYSRHFADSGMDPELLHELIAKLADALHEHAAISVRIEQYGKGVI